LTALETLCEAARRAGWRVHVFDSLLGVEVAGDRVFVIAHGQSVEDAAARALAILSPTFEAVV
jgi:hypothetical protein